MRQERIKLTARRISAVHSQKGRTRGIQNCDFTAQGAEITALLGESGCGKSTLLNCLAGYYVDRKTARSWKHKLAPIRSRKLGIYDGNFEISGSEGRRQNIALPVRYLPQHPSLFDDASIWENISIATGVMKVGSRNGKVSMTDFLRGRAAALLNAFNMDVNLSQGIRHLSGGERQRVSIVRTLAVQQQSLLMLDEPFNGLDYATRRAVERQLREFVRETNSICLIVSHDIHELAPLADSLLIFQSAGESLFTTRQVSPDEPFSQPTFEQLKVLYGGSMGVLAEENFDRAKRYVCVIPRGVSIKRQIAVAEAPKGHVVVNGSIKRVNPIYGEILVDLDEEDLQNLCKGRFPEGIDPVVVERACWIPVESIDSHAVGRNVKLVFPDESIIAVS